MSEQKSAAAEALKEMMESRECEICGVLTSTMLHDHAWIDTDQAQENNQIVRLPWCIPCALFKLGLLPV